MCHLTKKHKDRSLGSQSRALEVCGSVYDRTVPLLPVASVHRDSMDESRLDPTPIDGDGYQDLEYSSSAVEDEDDQSLLRDASSLSRLTTTGSSTTTTTTTKPSISSIIDHHPNPNPNPSPESNAREALSVPPVQLADSVHVSASRGPLDSGLGLNGSFQHHHHPVDAGFGARDVDGAH